MTAYVALLRAVNVGGRQLKMADLKADRGRSSGSSSPRTYIASGNLLFASGKSEAALKRDARSGADEHMGKPVGVMVRTAKEMAAVVEGQSLRRRARQQGRRDLPRPSRRQRCDRSRRRMSTDERMALGEREIYVHYPERPGPLEAANPGGEAPAPRAT